MERILEFEAYNCPSAEKLDRVLGSLPFVSMRTVYATPIKVSISPVPEPVAVVKARLAALRSTVSGTQYGAVLKAEEALNAGSLVSVEPIEFITFSPMTALRRDMLFLAEPTVFNQCVDVLQYRVVVANIVEDTAALQARLQSMLAGLANPYNEVGDAIRAFAKSRGVLV